MKSIQNDLKKSNDGQQPWHGCWLNVSLQKGVKIGMSRDIDAIGCPERGLHMKRRYIAHDFLITAPDSLARCTSCRTTAETSIFTVASRRFSFNLNDVQGLTLDHHIHINDEG